MLLADRFISLDRRTVDLASGDAVVFRRLAAGDRALQLAWSERCAGRCLAPAPGGACLIDYGLLADGGRFEAYRPAGADDSGDEGHAIHGRIRGADRPAIDGRHGGAGDAFGALLEQASDLLASGRYGQPHRLRLPIPGRWLNARLLDVIARRARLSGFVPVSVAWLLEAQRKRTAVGAPLREILEGRHVLLISRTPIACTQRGWCAADDEHSGPCPVGMARLMLAAGARSARPNLLLTVTPVEARAPVRPACLVVPRACGRPAGAIVGGPRAVRPGGSPIAAEAHEAYRVAGSRPDVSRLRARAVDVMRRVVRGQARAEHGLREVMGGLVRRDDAAGAAWVALSLGRLLLDRGRALDAAQAFEGARTHFDRANDLPGAARAAVYLGLAWTDEGRLPEAEAACRMARMAAEETGLTVLSADAAVALGRCLYWQGRFDEATVLASSLADGLERLPVTDGQPATAQEMHASGAGSHRITLVRENSTGEEWGERGQPIPTSSALAADEVGRPVKVLALASRLALATANLLGASAHAVRAVEAAAKSTSAIDDCVARTARAAIKAALRDTDGALEEIQAGLLAARRAHAPLRALRLRLLACDALRLAGRQREAARLQRHLAALNPDRLPALLRTRLQLIVGADARAGARSASAIPEPLVAASCPWRLASGRQDVGKEIAAVLQVCHDVEDEEAALGRVCETLRERIGAVSVGFIGRDDRAPAVLACAGPGASRSTLVDRVLDTGQQVAAIETPVGLEAATPVRYAGSVIGAVACRWPADTIVDAGRAGCLLSAAAAGGAPHARSLLDRRAGPRADPCDDETTIVGVSEGIQMLRKAGRRAADAPFPVLVEGESGSGKELVARAIHRDSARRLRRFCALNCAALTDELLEAELFGHVRGAFTGAVTDRVGLFEEADGGTLFLDEVADLSARAQAKLLRALQDGEVRRVGENVARHVDARVIAATNRRLETEVAAGTFRRDLYYRLNVVHIDVPALRDRPEDIAVLAVHFWQRSAARVGSRATLAPGTIAALSRYDWPGNVRELQNVMAALAVSAPRRGSVGPACLPAIIARTDATGATLDEARRSFERRFVQAALARAAGHRGRAATALGVSRQGLAKLIVRLGLGSDDE